MSESDWLNVETGDSLVCSRSGVRRLVMSVRRCSGKRGQGGNTRTSVIVPSLKQPSRTTVIFSTDGARTCCLKLEKAPRHFRANHDPGDEHQADPGEEGR